MKKLHLLWNVLRTINAHIILGSYFIFLLFAAAIIQFLEPNIISYGDAVWYCFAIFSTCGFGDFYAVTLAGRIISVFLGLYSLLVVALITGICVTYYMEFNNLKTNETVCKFLDQLEHLQDLSHEELEDLSDKVKERHYKL